jgi:uncharacterized membrane protein YkoI
MKTRHLITSGMLLLITPLLAEEIMLNELPAAARRTLDREARNIPVKKIIRAAVDGQPVYVVELEKDKALNPRLRIAENGDLLPEPKLPAGASAYALDPTAPAPIVYPALTLGDLPESVQQTVRNEARGREIGDIDRETWQGRTVYEVEFRAKGNNPQIHVAENGALVPEEDSRRGAKELFRGTQLSDTPAAVQATIQREASGRPINDIDVERRTGQVTYEVEIRDPHLGVFQLHVDADGRILKDSRADAPQPKP